MKADRENTSPTLTDELAAFDQIQNQAASIRQQLGQVIVGQERVIGLLLTALLAEGHVLLIGVPGLAKTLLVRTLARSLGWEFSRVQFTPDMMPADVIGSELIQVDQASGERSMRFAAGPVFANLLLADEINRTPPRTQAALLEAMAERQVTVGGQSRALPDPFVVVATQNPIEQEGTYPLPEAQLDRFMFSLTIDYPDESEEREIIRDVLPGGGRSGGTASVEAVMSLEQARAASSLIRRMPVSEHIVEYAARLVRASRPDHPDAPESIREYAAWGAGPRAGQFLVLAARALAAIEGKPTPDAQHIRRVAPAVLSHRLIINYAATGDGVSADDLVKSLLEAVPEPDGR